MQHVCSRTSDFAVTLYIFSGTNPILRIHDRLHFILCAGTNCELRRLQAGCREAPESADPHIGDHAFLLCDHPSGLFDRVRLPLAKEISDRGFACLPCWFFAVARNICSDDRTTFPDLTAGVDYSCLASLSG